MKFTYQAPVEYNDLSSGFRTVESEYLGPHDFKVFVDKELRTVTHGVEFDHDGHPDVHGGSDKSAAQFDMIYLHSHNSNHIALMAMICNHEDHKVDNQVEVVCEKYNMVYQRHEPMALDHVYDLRKCTIDTNGIVTYAHWQLVWTWEMLVAQGKSHKNAIRERQRVDILTADQHAKADYCCEIIDYVILNEVSKKHPWKIAWPNIHSVALDNSKPIGLGEESTPNGPRDLPRTEAWGAVPHEPAYHMDGDDAVIDAICPTTAEEANKLQPWTGLTLDHPTHKDMVDKFEAVRQSLIDANPDIRLTTEMVQAAHKEQLAKESANN